MAHEAEIKLFDIIDEGKMVKVSRASIKSMKDCFSDGSTVETDAIIFATGWQNASNPLFSPDLANELGLPVPCASLSELESGHWQDLDVAADKQVLEAYPMLANPPPQIKSVPRTETQLRQLRTIVPPKLARRGDRSIVFLGQLNNTQNFYFAETSALWAVAYLSRLLPVDSFSGHFDDMSKEIALHNAFMRWRYPGWKNTPYAVLEIRDWIDATLRDMGIRMDRNRFRWEKENPGKWTLWGWRPWVAEWFEPYEPVAYRGIVDELFEHVKEREEKRIAM